MAALQCTLQEKMVAGLPFVADLMGLTELK
jgi:hypothetical protein